MSKEVQLFNEFYKKENRDDSKYNENEYRDDLLKVNMYQAEQHILHNDIEYDALFKLIGFEVINKYLESKLGIYKVSYLVDFASILNTIDRGRVISFIFIDNQSGYINIDNYANYGIPLYNYLQSNKIAPFFLNDFMRINKSGEGYLTKNIDEKPNITNEVFIKDDGKDSRLEFKSLKINEKTISFAHTDYESAFKDFREEFTKSEDKEGQGPPLIKGIQEYIHCCFNEHFKVNNTKSPNKLFDYFLSIPILGTKTELNAKKEFFTAQGGLFFYVVSKNKINEKIFKEIACDINYIYKDILFNYYIAVGEQLAQETRIESIKSTVAAIMSRNMSHNLGSHVLSNLKNYLGNAAAAIATIKDEIICENGDCFEQKDLWGLKWFVNYLQERQDFIATIGGFENQTFMPVNFKTFVFDGLLPDHQKERHYDSGSIHSHKNYLFEYILKSENINREQIKVKFKSFDSDKHALNTEDDFNILTKINVSLPGGIVGRQAFYSIFENIIRNAGKHNTINGDLILTMDTPDEKDYNTNEYIKFTITDNVKSKDNLKEKLKEALEKLHKAVNDKIFDETQERKGNKGIKEIKISAAWLRGIPLEDIDEFEEKVEGGIIQAPKIIDIVESNDDYNKETIQYVFYLLKPKELLIYLKDNSNVDLSHKELETLNKHGVDIISPAYFNNNPGSRLRHSLFIIQEELKNDKNVELYFNQRRKAMKMNRDGINSIDSIQDLINKNKNNPTDLISAFWEKYLISLENEKPTGNKKPINKKTPVSIRGKDSTNKITNGFCEKPSSNLGDNSNIKILFNHHNDTKNSFDIFKNKNCPNLFERLYFLEGISGGNSTELLTTKVEKTKLFYYKLMQSCLTEVVVFDERLWNNNSKTPINSLPDIVEAPNDRESAKKNNDYKYYLYSKKNIEIANIVFREKDKEKDKEIIQFYNLYLKKIGYYTVEKGLILNGIFNENYTTNRIFSIHQGLIDKMESFISEKTKNKTINICEDIKKQLPDDVVKIIHSGRGKPTVDIPKGYYYVPYASLESAFYDCKYSLTDLLFNTKSEIL